MAAVLFVATLAALALGSAATAAGVGAVVLFPTALVLVCCAALSATNDPYEYLLSPQLGYVQTAAPILIAIGAPAAPILAAREAARHGGSPVSAAAGVEVALLLLGAAMAWWLGKRIADRTAVAA